MIDNYLNMRYTLVITPDDEGYGIRIPDLPGCYTHAKNWADIQDRVREAMTLWLTVMLEDGKPVPEPMMMA